MGKRPLLLWAVLVCCALVINAADKRFTLVIDAGHGGHDAGAVGNFSKEKNINLNVALAFGRYVEQNCPDVRIVYTRKTDKFVPLHERATIANRNKADLFISIHTNALPGGRTARGLETYTLGMHRAADNLDVAKRENSVILVEKDYKQHYEGFDPNSSESYIMFEFLQDRNMAKSVDLARLVQRRVCVTANRPDKGVKQAGFLVLRETSMPSCLIELGFISTADEEQLLNSDSGIDNFGRGIYLAFVDYRKKYDKRIAVPYQATQQEKEEPQPVAEKKETAAKAQNIRKQTSQTVIDELASARNAVPAAPSATARTAGQGAKTAAAQPPTAAAQSSKAASQSSTSASQSSKAAEQTPKAAVQEADTGGIPIFKVQIMASSRRLAKGSPQFKGVEDAESYVENGLYKYTVGSSSDYNEIYRTRKTLLEKFPEAFIVAFKGGSRTDVVQAIREFKSNRNKR